MISVKIDDNSFRQADRLLARLPVELRRKIVPRAFRSAVVPATKRMRQLAPDSRKSGSRSKWSQKLRASRASTKQHKRTIGTSSIRRYGEVVAIYAGPIHPAGNLINVIGHPHKQMLWGKDSGKTVAANQYVIDAGEQTKRQQQAVFEARVKAGVIRESLKK